MQDARLILRASRPRLWFAVIAQGGIGLLLVWVALAHPPAALGWRIFLLVSGGVFLWGTRHLLDAGRREIVFSGRALEDSGYGEICRIEDITAINRGAFAFKPARGFTLRLAHPPARHWVPGLWWRIGRNVGVGGLTGAAETRLMADVIEMALATRKAREAETKG